MSQQAAGLCRWLSTFPGIHVEALDELADGSVLHHVLHAMYVLVSYTALFNRRARCAFRSLICRYPNDTAEPAPLDPLLQSSSPAKKSKREDDGDEEEQDEAAYAGRFNSLKRCVQYFFFAWPFTYTSEPLNLLADGRCRLVADMIRCSNDDNLQTFISQVKKTRLNHAAERVSVSYLFLLNVV